MDEQIKQLQEDINLIARELVELEKQLQQLWALVYEKVK